MLSSGMRLKCERGDSDDEGVDGRKEGRGGKGEPTRHKMISKMVGLRMDAPNDGPNAL